jgi:hypothetical protein
VTPQEYLEWLVDDMTRRQTDIWEAFAAEAGQRVEFVNGVPNLRLVDEAQYRASLAAGGLTPEEVEQRLAVEASMSEEDWHIAAAEYPERLRAVHRFALELLRGRAGRVAAVPIGVAPVPMLDAGAAPVPGGGDVVVVAAGLGQMFMWLALDVIALGNDGLGHAIDRPPELGAAILRAMPGLARGIMYLQPCHDVVALAALVRDVWSSLPLDVLERRSWIAEAFVVLHELGHVLLGHTGRASGAEQARGHEHEADALAARALRDCGDVIDVMAALRGLFGLFRFAEPILAPADPLATHPPALERFRVAAREVYADRRNDDQLVQAIEGPRSLAYRLGGG